MVERPPVKRERVGSTPTSSATPPLYPHQRLGARWLAERQYGLLGFEMRTGKTRTVVEAVQALAAEGKCTKVLVVAPAQGRKVWVDPDPMLGQVAEYSRGALRMTEYAVREQRWYKTDAGEVKPWTSKDTPPGVAWVVTNYEYVRRKEHREKLLKWVDRSTVLVLDESMAVSNSQAKQHRACAALRKRAGWCWLLNGTPSGDNPEDIHGQFTLMDPAVLGGPYLGDFRARYAVMNPFGYHAEVPIKVAGKWVKKKVPVEVERWTNLDDLAARTAPHILRVTMEQVYKDMPGKLPPQVLEVPLSPETWRIYREMKRESLAWLDANRSASAAQAGVRMLRLAQITGGHVGGVEDGQTPGAQTAQIGTEKLTAVMDHLCARLRERPQAKVVVWARFRAEVDALVAALRALLVFEVQPLYGGQGQEDRDRALRLLHPRTAPGGPAALVGTPQTGSMVFNFAAANEEVFFSNDWSLLTRQQAEARVLGPDQKLPASYLDIVATGPKGERTVDHVVAQALREKNDVSAWTANAWLRALED